MKQRAIFKINGQVLYDSGLRDDIEVEYIEEQDIDDDLVMYGKPASLVSLTIDVNVTDPHTVDIDPIQRVGQGGGVQHWVDQFTYENVRPTRPWWRRLFS